MAGLSRFASHWCSLHLGAGCQYMSEATNLHLAIDHFTVSSLVAWPLNESEAGGDLVLIETSLLFSC